jgi:hypothetical protein
MPSHTLNKSRQLDNACALLAPSVLDDRAPSVKPFPHITISCPPEMTAPLRRLSSWASSVGSVMVSTSHALPARVLVSSSLCMSGARAGSACDARQR